MSLLDIFRRFDPIAGHRRLPFSPRAQRVLELARDHARREARKIPNSSDVVVGLQRLEQGTAWNVLERLGVNIEEVPPGSGTSVMYTELLPIAETEMRALQHCYLGTEHLLIALLKDRTNGLSEVLSGRGLTEEILREEIRRELDPRSGK